MKVVLSEVMRFLNFYQLSLARYVGRSQGQILSCFSFGLTFTSVPKLAQGRSGERSDHRSQDTVRKISGAGEFLGHNFYYLFHGWYSIKIKDEEQ